MKLLQMEYAMIQAIAPSGALLAGLLAQAGDGVISDVPEPGGYMSMVKIVVMIVLLIPWLLVAPWIHRDSTFVRARPGMWGAIILAAGGVGFLVWLLLPIYFIGLLVYALAVATVVGAYIPYRNGRVKLEEQKITLSKLFSFKRTRKPQVEIETKIRMYDAQGKVIREPDPVEDPNTVRAYNATQDLLYDMVYRRASEAELAPAGEQARVLLVIDGLPTQRPSRSQGEAEMIINYLKEIGGMDVEERRRPQEGKISLDLAGSLVDVTLTTAGTTSGQRVQFRIVQEYVQTRLGELGLSEELLGKIRELISHDSGLVLVSGPPKSGVTSTLYSLLREQDAFIKQLVTLEQKVEVDLENITQTAYGERGKLPRELASAMRRDPDVVMIDRCEQKDVAEQIQQAASEKLILLGLKANDTFTALAKWVKVSGEAAPAVQPLRGVICQILLRKLCPNCRKPYKPEAQMLAKANIPADKVDVFFRACGKVTNEKGETKMCPTCQGSGYLGRTAAFELLEMNDELRQLVEQGAGLSKLKSAARREGMLYLQEQALRKVIEGETSIQEVIRVSQEKKK